MPLRPIFASLASLAVIAFADYVTSYELSLQTLYALPGAIVAWHFGRGPGLAVALTSAAVWCLVDWLSGHRFTSVNYLIGNGFSVFAGSAAVAWIVARLRSLSAGVKPESRSLVAPLGVAGEAAIDDAASSARAWMRKHRHDSV